jgi:hypothetical protein
MSLKAWCYNEKGNPEVFWECRRVVQHLFAHRHDKVLKMTKVLFKELKHAWDRFEAISGEQKSAHVKPSVRVYRDSSQEGDDHKVRNEFSLSTLAMLWMTSWLAFHRREPGKTKACMMLRTFVQFACDPAIDADFLADVHDESLAEMQCDGSYVDPEDAPPSCSHCRWLHERLHDIALGPAVFEKFALLSMSMQGKCSRVDLWFVVVLCEVAMKLDERVLELDRYPPPTKIEHCNLILCVENPYFTTDQYLHTYALLLVTLSIQKAFHFFKDKVVVLMLLNCRVTC